MRPLLLSCRLAALATVVLSVALPGQVLDLTIHDAGLAIGDKPHVDGVRINFRDHKLRDVHGVNITAWAPYVPATGSVTGLALGLPLTGADKITGVAAGLFGVGVGSDITGIGVGGIGLGAGGQLRGIMLGGIGVGGGSGITGFSFGGIGVGSGGSIRGIQIGGIGVGSGSDITGISIGGIGVAGGGNTTGLAIATIGVGGGKNFTGIGVAGIGVGGGGDMTGLMIGGVGVGSGGTIKGVAIGGIGVGAHALRGVAIGGISVGGSDVHAIVLAPAYFKVVNGGVFDGGSLSSVNNIQGTQRGLTIGLINYARELHGTQIGLINVSNNDGQRRILPLISVR